MTGFRLDKGGLIERRQKINFRFNGQQVTGFKGDTIASALMASGHMLVGRSFKYHRPRGICLLVLKKEERCSTQEMVRLECPM